MIISKTVLVNINSSNIYYFESKGYSIPKQIDKHKRIVVKRGNKIEVKVSDLPKGSHIKVLCKCDVCKKEKLIIFKSLTNIFKYLCHSCSHKKLIGDKRLKFWENKNFSLSHKNKLCSNNWNAKHTGKNSPLWNFKLSDKERGKQHQISGINQWKRKVKERDNHTCQKCGSKEFLQVHHINNFKDFEEQRTDINNGITLCQECHKAIHKQFGLKTKLSNLLEFLNHT